jgi:histidine triad (HIT) family protein
MECLFCKIIAKTLPSQIIYEDAQVVAFSDIRPQAPVHKLLVPRKHIATINDLAEQDTELVGYMIQIARQLAQKFGTAETGYRLVFNCNAHGGQEVYHIHLHLLAGRQMHWPPG